jgi:hypothetical protein
MTNDLKPLQLEVNREAFAIQIAAGFAQKERGDLIDSDNVLRILSYRRARCQAAGTPNNPCADLPPHCV